MLKDDDPWAEFEPVQSAAPVATPGFIPGVVAPKTPTPQTPVQAEQDAAQLEATRLRNIQLQRELDEGTAAKTAESEKKNAAFLRRALGAAQKYETEGDLSPRSLVGQKVYEWAPDELNSLPAVIGNSAARQVGDQASEEFISGVLRSDSGATIPPEEMAKQKRIYFPLPGDGPDVIQAKRESRIRAIQGLASSAGRSIDAPLKEEYDNWLESVSAAPPAAEGGVAGPVPAANAAPDDGYAGLRVDVTDDRVPWETEEEYIARSKTGAPPPPRPEDPIVSSPSLGRQAFDAVINPVAGFAEGAVALPDYAAKSVGTIAALPFELAGNDYVANALRNPLQVGQLIEEAVPVPQDWNGWSARQVARLGGGALGMPVKSTNALTEIFAGKPPPTLPGGMNALRTIPNAKDVVREGEEAGINVLTSDVRPPRTFMGKTAQSIGEKIPFVGTGGRRAKQQIQRVQAVKDVLREYGGDDVANLFDDAPSAVEGVAKDLVERRSSQLTRLKAAKDAVIDKFTGPVSTPNAIRALDEQIARLKGINDDVYSDVIGRLESFKAQISSGKTLRQIEGNRAILGDMFKDPSLAAAKNEGQKAIDAIYNPLREDMGQFIKANGARADFGRWKGANDQLSAMAGELKSGAFKNLLNNAETTPENAGKLLFSQKASDVQRLVANLSPAGRAKAQAAILQRAFDKAVSADSGLSVERFVNNLDSLSSSVGVAFKGADKERIAGLARVLDATRRASGASAMPPTGVQNVPVAGGYALGALFGQAAIPVAALGGTVARIYESAPVRSLLLELARTKPGSRQEGVLMGRVAKMVAPMLANSAANDVASPVARMAAEDNGQDGR